MKQLICDICKQPIEAPYLPPIRCKFKAERQAFVFRDSTWIRLDVCGYCVDTIRQLSLQKRNDSNG